MFAVASLLMLAGCDYGPQWSARDRFARECIEKQPAKQCAEAAWKLYPGTPHQ